MTRPRNIILLVADSLRYDSVHQDGETGLRWTTPHATRFTQARSGGCWTLPSTASLFTGLMPHEHGADAQSRGVLPQVPTLAEKLRERGFRTHQVTANVATTEIFGLDRGFDEIRRIWKFVPARHRKLHEALVLIGKPRLRKRILSPEFVAGKLSEDIEASKVWLQNTVDDVFDHTRQVIAENERQGKPSFVFVNLMETHFPYHVAPTFETIAEGLVDKVREVVSLFHLVNQTWLTTDHQPIDPEMMKLLRRRQRQAWTVLAPKVDAFLEEMHADGDNQVVFCADHGDCFGEQGWAYHFSNVADGGNRVPLYWLRRDGGGGNAIDTPVSARDLYHSILHEVGEATASPHLLAEPERSYPIMQSAWYNNQGKTLAKFKYNQICFLEGGMRWLKRRGEWWSAPPASEGPEPEFTRLPAGVNPLEEAIVDRERRAHLQRVLADFEAFSAKHAA